MSNIDYISKLVTYFQGAGVAVPFQKDYMDDTPDEVNAIYETTGIATSAIEGGHIRAFQLASRSDTVTDARANNWDLYKKLFSTQSIVTIEGEDVKLIYINTPIKINKDGQNRTIFAFNVLIVVPYKEGE